MDNYSIQITDYLLTQTWQIAVLAAVIAVGTVALKNRSAHVRYLLWLIILAKCLVPPLLTVPLPVLPEERARIILVPPEPIAAEPGEIQVAEAPAPSAPAVVKEAPRFTIHQGLALGWTVGISVFILVAVGKALRTEFWLRQERKPLAAGLQSEIKDIFSSLGDRISPKLWLVEGIGQPFVWGLLRGSIYLPGNFTKVDVAEQRKGILGHELSHILRFDAAVNLLQVVAQAIFWFHPFVWWANKRIRAEREKCCDEMTIARLGAKVKDYSSAIVNILITEQESTRPVPSLAVAGPVKNIEERIKAMLRPGKKFYKRPSPIATTIVILMAILTVPTALVLTGRAQTKSIAKQESAPAILLHQAAAHGDGERVKLLISRGADVNMKDEKGMTPLHLAARDGHTDVAATLIDKGANVNVKDERGRAPIIFAVWGKHKETIKLLLAKGADVNTTMVAFDAPGASRPLHEAIYDGNLDIAKLLIANGADVNAAGEFSWTPLHCAVVCGDRDLVELLLAKGSIGPVFHVAACKGDLGGVKRLLAQGRNVDEKDEQGCTPLYWSVATGQKEVVEFLLTSGADVNMRTGTGDAPLHRAVRHKKPRRDIVELLIAKGADVNMKSGWGGTYRRGMVPLHFAAIGGQKELVEMLLRNGADVSAKDGNGATALHHAVENAHKQIVEVLLANGADVDAKYRNGRTSLDEAAEHGYRDVAELLISKGANVNAKSNSGKTALMYAKENAHTEIVELLRKHGAKE